jgi:hypothetical protein
VFKSQKSIRNGISLSLAMERAQVDISKKTHKRFLKFVDFWPFGSKNKIFSFLGAISDYAPKFQRLKMFFNQLLTSKNYSKVS